MLVSPLSGHSALPSRQPGDKCSACSAVGMCLVPNTVYTTCLDLSTHSAWNSFRPIRQNCHDRWIQDVGVRQTAQRGSADVVQRTLFMACGIWHWTAIRVA